MKMQNIFLILLISILNPFLLSAQSYGVPTGGWKIHAPYNNSAHLAIGNNQLISASENAAFIVDLSSNEYSYLDKTFGLHDSRITDVGFHSKTNEFIISYASGGIEIIDSERNCTYYNDIIRSNIFGSKQINDIYIHNNLAYLSGDFGVTVFDFTKKEIKESYLTLLNSSESVRVFNAVVNNNSDSLFIATSKGILVATLGQKKNLLDYQNWHRYKPTDGIDTVKITRVGYGFNTAFAVKANDSIYKKTKNTWKALPYKVKTDIVGTIKFYEEKLYICIDDEILTISKEEQINTIKKNTITLPRDILFYNNEMYVADMYKGLVNQTKENYSYPNSIFSNASFRGFNKNDESIVITSGGYDQAQLKQYNNNIYFEYNINEGWQNLLNINGNAIFNEISDVSCGVYTEGQQATYIGSFGNGLIKINDDQTTTLYNYQNSILNKRNIDGSTETYISDITIDQEENIWIGNTNVESTQNSIFKIDNKGIWSGYRPPTSYSAHPYRLKFDQNNFLWIGFRGVNKDEGVGVYDIENNRFRIIQKGEGVGNLSDNKINDIEVDKKGNVIIATDKGICISYNPRNILYNNEDFTIPYYQGFPLLWERKVYAVAIDGANRKWFATDNGVWLFNENIDSTLAYYNNENSPLVSNTITDINIIPKTGEVFFCTNAGTVSFRGFSTDGEVKKEELQIYPNPVLPNFEGWINISGFKENSFFKITDINGQLVYDGPTLGGTVTWNLKNYNGEKVKTGIYLIFSTDKNGEEKSIGRFAVIE